MNITIVAYKPNSVDTCMGCVIEEFPSDCFIVTGTDVDEVAQSVAETVVIKERNNYDRFSYSAIIDGVHFGSLEATCLYEWDELYEELEDVYDKLLKVIYSEITRLHVQRNEEIRLEKERQERKQQELRNKSRIDLMKEIAEEAGYEVVKVGEEDK